MRLAVRHLAVAACVASVAGLLTGCSGRSGRVPQPTASCSPMAAATTPLQPAPKHALAVGSTLGPAGTQFVVVSACSAPHQLVQSPSPGELSTCRPLFGTGYN